MTLQEFIDRAPGTLEAFRLATLVQHSNSPDEFPLELEEWEWWKEISAYIIYTDAVGDMDPQEVNKLLGDSDGPDGS